LPRSVKTSRREEEDEEIGGGAPANGWNTWTIIPKKKKKLGIVKEDVGVWMGPIFNFWVWGCG